MKLKPGVLLFGTTIFLSAFLLFQIQPLISRYILPWFGGTPAVWSAALLFFQTFLLAGYAYAHWLAGQGRQKLRLHLAILAGSGLLLAAAARFWGTPLLPGTDWQPPDASLPFGRIILLLLVSVGLPYFLLASTSPLVQYWYKLAFPQHVPYQLYALSNLGSFLALITYPFLVEPALGLRQQAWLWAGGYLIYGILLAGAGLFAWQPSRSAPEPAVQPVAQAAEQPSRTRALHRFLWVLLPACSSLLLMAVTNQLTQEIAVIPFLWVLPLSLYLLSFSLTFAGERWYRRGYALPLLGSAAALLSYTIHNLTTIGVLAQIAAFSMFLLMGTLVLHGELYRLRPAAAGLTGFYLLVSLGGALGGLFVNLVAPLIFNGYWELHLGVLLVVILAAALPFVPPGPNLTARRLWLPAALFLIVAALTGSVLVTHIRGMYLGTLYMERNFYGVLRVRAIAAGQPPRTAYSLSHGITSHGFQYQEPDLRGLATTYYGPESGVGLVLQNLPAAGAMEARPLKVGLIGLGTGTLAVYGQPGDMYRFYEINPAVIELALGKGGYFSYLADSAAEIELVRGDARLALESELDAAQGQAFDLLAVDAFSSDAIPVHLLTEEAFALYLAHLDPRGVLAIHISNRYLDLSPLVQALGQRYGLAYGLVASPRSDQGNYPAVWVLLSRSQDFLAQPPIATRIESSGSGNKQIRLWTDDFSNLLGVVRREVLFRLH